MKKIKGGLKNGEYPDSLIKHRITSRRFKNVLEKLSKAIIESDDDDDAVIKRIVSTKSEGQ